MLNHSYYMYFSISTRTHISLKLLPMFDKCHSAFHLNTTAVFGGTATGNRVQAAPSQEGATAHQTASVIIQCLLRGNSKYSHTKTRI